jgi:integrase/recombinase XerD
MQSEIQTFLEHLAMNKSCSINTIAAYRNDLGQFQSYLTSSPTAANGMNGWRDLAEGMMHAYVHYLQEQRYASATVARKLAAVRSFLNHLQETGHLADDISSVIRPPKVEKKSPQPIDIDMIQRLLAEPARKHDTKSVRDKALLEVLCATGMRVTEVVNLNVEDIDFTTQTITCGAHSVRRRVVTVYRATADALLDYLALDQGRTALLKQQDEQALFLNQRGQRLTRQGLWLIIREYATAVGIGESITPHALRHSFAAHLLDSGANPQDVQKRMGNLSAGSTKFYRMQNQPTGNEVLLDGIPYERTTHDHIISTRRLPRSGDIHS